MVGWVDPEPNRSFLAYKLCFIISQPAGFDHELQSVSIIWSFVSSSPRLIEADLDKACGCFTKIFVIISRPGQSQRLLYKHLCDQLINSFIHPLLRISLRRRHAQMVTNGASNHKTKYIYFFQRL